MSKENGWGLDYEEWDDAVKEYEAQDKKDEIKLPGGSGWGGFCPLEHADLEIQDSECLNDVPECSCGGLLVDKTGNLHEVYCPMYGKITLGDDEK